MNDTLTPKPFTLFVDDDEITRELMAEIFSEEKIPHIICANGREALDVFSKKNHGIEVAISDVNMDVLDGISLMLAIEQNCLDGNTRKYLCTGNVSSYIGKLRDLVSRNAIQGYFQKPVGTSAILDVVYKGICPK